MHTCITKQKSRSIMLRFASILMVVLIATFDTASGRGGRHRKNIRSEEETKNYLDYIAKLERLWWAAHENDIPAAKKALKEGAEIDDFYVRCGALSLSLPLSLSLYLSAGVDFFLYFVFFFYVSSSFSPMILTDP